MRPYCDQDGILLLLLFMGFFVIIAQWLIYTLQSKKEKRYGYRLKQSSQHIFNYFYKYPSSTLRSDYPHLADVADATKAYEKLNRLYDQGQIDEIDYNLELEKLLPKVNIEQDF